MAVQKLTPGSPTTPVGQVRKQVFLPTQKTVPPTELEAYTIFIYGQQKIGKTSFTTHFKSVLHIMFEPSGKDYSLWEIQPKSWTEFKGYIELLKEQKRNGTLEYKTFTIDTIDLCFSMCSNYVCDNAGVQHPSDIAYGKLYQEIEVEFRDTIIELSRLGGFIALTHEKDKEVETRKGRKYSMTVPSSAPACNKIMAKFCDIIGYYHVGDDGKRCLQIRPSEEAEAGNRLESKFKYTDGVNVETIPMGNSAIEAYTNFVKAFNNQLVRPVSSTEGQEQSQEKPKSIIKLTKKGA